MIYQEIQSIIDRYDTPVCIMEGLDFSQSKTLKMCEFYSNSKYLGGDFDELGRIKPFYNIVNFRVTLAKVATDMDIKDVQILSDNPAHQVKSMLLNRESYEWMKKSDFSTTLNKLGYKRAKYGGVLVKKVEKKGDLKIEVVDWRNVFTDQVDILGNPIVETHYMTPIELKAKYKVWEGIDEALREIKKCNLVAKRAEDKINRIKVYEVHGQFPIQYLNEAQGKESKEDDEFEYSNQVYFIGVIKDKEYYFYSDTEKESPYDYLAWEEMEGRALGRGVIEDSEQSQVWTNHSVINENNAMDLAGKVVMKTNSKKLGNNILEIDNGKIFELGDTEDINPVNLTPSALGNFQNQINLWRDQVDNATGAFDSITGEQPPSGTPYSQTVFLNQVASRPYDYRLEEQGIFISRLWNNWVIPHLIQRLYKKHILVSEFSTDELEVIDQSFVKHANKIIIDQVLAMPQDGTGELPTQESFDKVLSTLKSNIKGLGAKRYIEIPEGYFDDIEAKVTVLSTNEQKNKAIILQSLSSVLQTVISSYDQNTGKFAVLEDPKLSRIFGEVLEMSGIPGLSAASLGIGRESEGTAPAVAEALQSPELVI
jgi:hypothetical protein